MYSGTSTTGAGSSPAVPIAPVYSGTSTTGAGSSPAVPIAPVYSGTSWTEPSSPFTPPVNSGTSCTAGSVLAVSTSSLVNWIRYSLTFLPLSETRRTKTGSLSSPLSTTVDATFSPASTVTLGRFPL